MNINKILGIVVPSYESTKMLGEFVPSLVQLEEVRNISTLLINANGKHWEAHPELLAELRETLDRMGWKYVLGVGKMYDTKGGTPIAKISEDTAQLLGSCLIYVRVDDDFKFLDSCPSSKGMNAGKQYLSIVHYMLTNPRCGTVKTNAFIGKKPPHGCVGIAPDFISSHAQTFYGLFLRNINPNSSEIMCKLADQEIKDGMEEYFYVLYRGELGYHVARMNNLRVRHKPHTKFGETNGRWNEVVLGHATIPHIKATYNPNFKTGRSVVNTEKFYSNGGSSYSELIKDPNSVIDYSVRDFNEVYEEVLKMGSEQLEKNN